MCLEWHSKLLPGSSTTSRMSSVSAAGSEFKSSLGLARLQELQKQPLDIKFQT